MADRSADSWYPPAAYLYVPHLDGLALAWEYLRRHPDYRRDWLPRLHPEDALSRAHHRAWMEFGSSLLNTIAAFYNAKDDATLNAQADQLRARLAQVEAALADGPWFAGERFGLVDAVFGPVFRYFDVFDGLGDFYFFDELPKATAWRAALAGRESVREAAHPEYPALLRDFLRRRDSALSRRMALD